MATDAPSYKLFTTLKEIMPNLVALSLDPVHLSMHYESASGCKKTAGSAALRRCMAKFNNQDASMACEQRWQFFTKDAKPFTSAEEAFRTQILDGSMGEAKARRVLQKSEELLVWTCRKDFLEHLAAISSCFRPEVVKKSVVQAAVECHAARSVGLLVQQFAGEGTPITNGKCFATSGHHK